MLGERHRWGCVLHLDAGLRNQAASFAFVQEQAQERYAGGEAQVGRL
jgi:hypothetical protein